MTAAPAGSLGAHVENGGARFRIWAPRLTSLKLGIAGRGDLEMGAEPDGYFSLWVEGAKTGDRYGFLLDEGFTPDPVSRFQPEGPAGPSMIVDPAAFRWSDNRWPGAPPRHRQVVYEMHIGTFTQAGTWASAIERLPALAALGVTTLEVMPVAEFAGRFGWGYDGVFLFAPFHMYGTPDDARTFVDEAHRLGLAVILDVVYNHLGPVGNVLTRFSDWYFAEHETEWGRGFNVDADHSAPVRAFMRANVEHWVREYHVDGLRFDATQAIPDRSPEHIVNELTRHARQAALPRRLFVVGENESQNVAFLKADDQAQGGIDALWNEDWHHAAVVSLAGNRQAYFTDYEGSAREFASMAVRNFLYQGQWYSWQKQPRGSRSSEFPGSAFVSFLENHDQVANTGHGQRLYQTVNQAHWRALVALLLLGPSIPMLFQGQECASASPFFYFADHQGELARLVREGRLEFLSQFPSLRDPGIREIVPDPADSATFCACKIDWKPSPAAEMARRLHGDLLVRRRSDAVLAEVGTTAVKVASSTPAEGVVLVRYSSAAGERLVLVNLEREVRLRMNDPLLAPPPTQTWDVAWCSEGAEYGGTGFRRLVEDGRWLLQAHCAWLLTGRAGERLG
jgi:maltooligosyltrehalose trehalohydrolase